MILLLSLFLQVLLHNLNPLIRKLNTHIPILLLHPLEIRIAHRKTRIRSVQLLLLLILNQRLHNLNTLINLILIRMRQGQQHQAFLRQVVHLPLQILDPLNHLGRVAHWIRIDQALAIDNDQFTEVLLGEIHDFFFAGEAASVFLLEPFEKFVDLVDSFDDFLGDFDGEGGEFLGADVVPEFFCGEGGHAEGDEAFEWAFFTDGFGDVGDFEFEFEGKFLEICDFDVCISPSLLKRKLKIFLCLQKRKLFLIKKERIQKLLSHIHVRIKQVKNIDLNTLRQQQILPIISRKTLQRIHIHHTRKRKLARQHIISLIIRSSRSCILKNQIRISLNLVQNIQHIHSWLSQKLRDQVRVEMRSALRAVLK